MLSHEHAVPTIFSVPGAPDLLALAARFKDLAHGTIKESHSRIPASESKKAD